MIVGVSAVCLVICCIVFIGKMYFGMMKAKKKTKTMELQDYMKQDTTQSNAQIVELQQKNVESSDNIQIYNLMNL